MSATSHWVFAYGSLIWRPGFEFLQAVPAELNGWHRKLCVYSHKYRGTPEKLGLVFGLDAGGSCRGLAYEVAASRWPETHAYLTERELITRIYREVELPVFLPETNRAVSALTYVVDPQHEQYAAGLDTTAVLKLVRQGKGEAGACTDYVVNTARHLRDLGMADAALEELVRQL
jgi:glutathione-specific gamma-glutamylcyclotransferase